MGSNLSPRTQPYSADGAEVFLPEPGREWCEPLLGGERASHLHLQDAPCGDFLDHVDSEHHVLSGSAPKRDREAPDREAP